MKKTLTAMEIYKYLPKTNCKECHVASCFAFASFVFKGDKQPDMCPYLSPEAIAELGGTVQPRQTADKDALKTFEELKKKIHGIDLKDAADRIGADYSNGKLSLKILGKIFNVDDMGNCHTDIHIHPWLGIPIFNYILHSKGMPVSGNWVPMRELKSGMDWHTFFGHRCEKPMKKIADSHPDLFEDLIRIFNGKKVEQHYQSDISLVLYPLPKLPMLICYWKADDGMPSDLNIFFDETAENNLAIESIWGIASGIVFMFEKISVNHGFSAMEN